ncbi:MAG TPA: hypothetical protein VI911_10820 [Patescibacteria group bacterium]|nr:hypothetical protein [Patescibacteria group bacterium]
MVNIFPREILSSEATHDYTCGNCDKIVTKGSIYLSVTDKCYCVKCAPNKIETNLAALQFMISELSKISAVFPKPMKKKQDTVINVLDIN